MRKRFLPVCIVLMLFLGACGTAGSAPSGQPATPSPTSAPTPEPTPEPTPIVIDLALAGDIVMHTPLNTEALTEDGTYDYTPIFEDVRSYIEAADLALCCLETVFTGDGVYTGYPTFHSPDALAWSLKDVGFDLINTASNHAMDGWQPGLIRTLDILDAAGLKHVGSYRSQEERDANNGILVVDVDGVSIAFLNYTYGTNGFPVTGIEYALNVYYIDYLDYFTTIDYDMVSADMAAARALGCDFIAVSVHWGGEYILGATDQQTQFADYLIREGADLVIGGHPHVPEPIEWRSVTQEDGTERTALVCYCLGNLLSCQDRYATDLTAVLQVEITKDPLTGRTYISDCGYVPMVMVDLLDYGIYSPDWRYRLWDLRQAVADYEAGEDRGVMTQYMYSLFTQDLETCRTVFGELEAPVA